jgi:LPPG:FO 2-phospho-L-lactate transferase
VRRAFDVEVRLLPATDDPVETRIHTEDGRDLHFQEYWVRERATPPVASVELAGRDRATAGPGVVETLLDADAVLVAPSNPVVSIGTILAVPGLAATLRQTPAPVVGVSPIVGGQVVRGMAHRLLPAVGAEVSAVGVARHYCARATGGLLDGWVIDQRDGDQREAVEAVGLSARVTDTMMDDAAVAAALAQVSLDLATEIEGRS